MGTSSGDAGGADRRMGVDTIKDIRYSCPFLTCHSLSTLDRSINSTTLDGDGDSGGAERGVDEYFHGERGAVVGGFAKI